MGTRMTQAEADLHNARVESGRTDKLWKLQQEVLARPTHLAKPSVDRESVLQEAIASECRRRGWLYDTSRMDKATGRTIGAPDFYVFGDEGRWWAIECKVGNSKQTSEQQCFQRHMAKLGHENYFVVRSLAEFIAVVTPIQT